MLCRAPAATNTTGPRSSPPGASGESEASHRGVGAIDVAIDGCSAFAAPSPHCETSFFPERPYLAAAREAHRVEVPRGRGHHGVVRREALHFGRRRDEFCGAEGVPELPEIVQAARVHGAVFPDEHGVRASRGRR
jgi:hypothetical protein